MWGRLLTFKLIAISTAVFSGCLSLADTRAKFLGRLLVSGLSVHRPFMPIVMMVIGLTVSGCSIISIDKQKSLHYQGDVVTANSLGSMQLGYTRKQWALEYLGQPSQRRVVSPERERFTYWFTQKNDSSTRILLLFRHRQQTLDTTTYVLEFCSEQLCGLWGDDILAQYSAPHPMAHQDYSQPSKPSMPSSSENSATGLANSEPPLPGTLPAKPHSNGSTADPYSSGAELEFDP